MLVQATRTLDLQNSFHLAWQGSCVPHNLLIGLVPSLAPAPKWERQTIPQGPEVPS